MPAIVHLLNAYLPATETFIWQYLRQAQDFEPYILADKWENLERFPLPSGESNLLRLVPKRPAWSRAWAALRGQYAPVDYVGWRDAFRAHEVVMAHAHQGFRAIVTQRLLRKSGLPFAASFYGSDVSRTDILRRSREGYREVFQSAGLLCAEGPKLQKRLMDLGAPEAKVKLVRIAIDMADYEFRERRWDGKEPLRMLFTGRLVEKKGLAYALRALAEFSKRQGAPDFRFTVVGDGPLAQPCRKLAEELGLQARVDWKGMLPLSALKDLLASHHVLLAPSCTAENGDSEGGAPTVILEAQATGMPVIATTHDDIPFITVPNQSAYLAAERNVPELTEALVKWASHPGSWAAMGQAGREHIAQFHDSRAAIHILEAHYRATINLPRRT